MPFDSSFENVRLIKGYLTIVHQGKPLTLDLNGCLSAVNGSFKWGGNGGFKAAKNPSLINGSMLRYAVFLVALFILHSILIVLFSAELPYGKGQWQKAQIELNTNIEVKDGQLVFRDPASWVILIYEFNQCSFTNLYWQQVLTPHPSLDPSPILRGGSIF